MVAEVERHQARLREACLGAVQIRSGSSYLAMMNTGISYHCLYAALVP